MPIDEKTPSVQGGLHGSRKRGSRSCPGSGDRLGGQPAFSWSETLRHEPQLKEIRRRFPRILNLKNKVFGTSGFFFRKLTSSLLKKLPKIAIIETSMKFIGGTDGGLSTIAFEEVAHVINDWYKVIRQHNFSKAAAMREEIENMLPNMAENQNVLLLQPD
ncbi:hypothetical protein ACO1D0_00570 [Bacillus licheniformis]|uniref:response regulator aspartate phosphatase n=1 Tax=Bacillus licheniformis TaxID=1402 RepID=UPI003BF73D03